MCKSLGHNSFSEKTHESSKIVVFTNEFLQDLVFVFFKNKRNRVGLKNKGLFLLFVFIYEYTTSTGFFPPFSCVFRILIGDSFFFFYRPEDPKNKGLFFTSFFCLPLHQY